jgi:hypothetical protein
LAAPSLGPKYRSKTAAEQAVLANVVVHHAPAAWAQNSVKLHYGAALFVLWHVVQGMRAEDVVEDAGLEWEGCSIGVHVESTIT